MLDGSQTYFSAAEEQGNTGHTLVLTGSLGIQDSICWKNKTGTPPGGIIKHKMLFFSLFHNSNYFLLYFFYFDTFIQQ